MYSFRGPELVGKIKMHKEARTGIGQILFWLNFGHRESENAGYVALAVVSRSRYDREHACLNFQISLSTEFHILTLREHPLEQVSFQYLFIICPVLVGSQDFLAFLNYLKSWFIRFAV